MTRAGRPAYERNAEVQVPDVKTIRAAARGPRPKRDAPPLLEQLHLTGIEAKVVGALVVLALLFALFRC